MVVDPVASVRLYKSDRDRVEGELDLISGLLDVENDKTDLDKW